MGMTPRFWTVNGLSTELGLDRRSLAVRLATTPPDAQVQGHAAWRLKTALAALGQSTRPQSELDAERAKLARSQREGHELKNAALRGELLPAAEVTAGWEAATGRSRALLLGIPTAAAGTLVMTVTSAASTQAAELRVHEYLVNVIDAALAELANTTLDEVEAEESGSDASTSVA
jgi:hypothetical protein